jgi:hypothetical protein
VAYYQTNPWINLINEEWQANTESVSSGAVGTHYWIPTSNGSTMDNPVNIPDGTGLSYLNVVTTNSSVARTFSIGSLNFMLATNAEIIFISRIRMSQTNAANNSVRTLVGLSDSTTVNEPSNGIYIFCNTNMTTSPTNNFVFATARASSRTFTYNTHASNNFTRFAWLHVGFRLDATGTNAIFFVGPSPKNLVSVATNSANIPNSVLTAPSLTVHRILGNGATRYTNYCDNIKMWVRPLSSNY